MPSKSHMLESLNGTQDNVKDSCCCHQMYSVKANRPLLGDQITKNAFIFSLSRIE